MFEFFRDWIRGRSRWKLAVGAVPIGFSIALLVLFARAGTAEYRQELSSRYDELALAALEDEQIEASELFFSRTVSLAEEKDERSCEIAKLLYKRGLQDRSLEILQGLAPMATPGFVPAHEFLAQHYQTLPNQTDVTRAIALFHCMHASGQLEEPRIRLAQFLSDRGYHDKAIRCLKGVVVPGPRLRLQLVGVYTRASDVLSATNQAKAAETELRDQLIADEANDEVRVLLSRSVACQGKLLDAIFLLAEGCEHRSSPVLADELVKCYLIWLSDMSADAKQRQLRQVSLALEIEDAEQPLTKVLLRNGASASLPRAIAELHGHVLKGEGQWLLTLLKGTHLAAAGNDYTRAIELLEQALAQRPRNVVIANNLAWAILQLAKERPAVEHEDSPAPGVDLARAWELANTAVERHPEEPEFRETRGQLASQLERWDEAIKDLHQCLAMGHSSSAIQATLERARRKIVQ